MQIGDANLRHGDCMELMRAVADQSVDLVLADLPYGTTNCRWDSPIPLDALWAEYNRICRGTVALFAQLPFDKVLGASNIRNLRFEWVWEKGNATGHLNARRAPMKAHEVILIFSQGQPFYSPIMTHGHARKASVKKRREDCPIYNEHDRTPYDSTSRFPRDVIKFSSDKQRGAIHPTQKPLPLVEYLLQTHSAPGHMVLDNCMGAGTTGVAAIKHNRRFIGMEIDRGFFDAACSRISEQVNVIQKEDQ